MSTLRCISPLSGQQREELKKTKTLHCTDPRNESVQKGRVHILPLAAIWRSSISLQSHSDRGDGTALGGLKEQSKYYSILPELPVYQHPVGNVLSLP